MTTSQVDYMNMGLMILAGTAAILLPFELFLFSYVILGPLHYLTELTWLHKKQFFLVNKWHVILICVLALAVLLPAFYKLAYTFTAQKGLYNQPLFMHIRRVGQIMFFVCFAAAAILVFIKKRYLQWAAIITAVIVGCIIRTQVFGILLFTLFIPTIIHVFVFTGAFLFAGALKTKNRSGILSVLVFVSCAVSLFFIFPHPVNHAAKNMVSAYDAGFFSLNSQLFAIFLHQHATRVSAYYSETGILVTRFIAFAYTYHYLNWFSKTSVIKWHLVSRKYLVMLVVIWLLAVALYFTDYLTGLAVLYFLSIIHVIFEFPLNFRTFRDIGQGLKKHLVRPR
jgi:hypothetical protein